jgi:hypothetical protein
MCIHFFHLTESNFSKRLQNVFYIRLTWDSIQSRTSPIFCNWQLMAPFSLGFQTVCSPVPLNFLGFTVALPHFSGPEPALGSLLLPLFTWWSHSISILYIINSHIFIYSLYVRLLDFYILCPKCCLFGLLIYLKLISFLNWFPPIFHFDAFILFFQVYRHKSRLSHTCLAQATAISWLNCCRNHLPSLSASIWTHPVVSSPPGRQKELLKLKGCTSCLLKTLNLLPIPHRGEPSFIMADKVLLFVTFHVVSCYCPSHCNGLIAPSTFCPDFFFLFSGSTRIWTQALCFLGKCAIILATFPSTILFSFILHLCGSHGSFFLSVVVTRD